MVVLAVLLAGARGAGGVRDGEAERVGVALKEQVVERALADARGAGDDDGAGVYMSVLARFLHLCIMLLSLLQLQLRKGGGDGWGVRLCSHV